MSAGIVAAGHPVTAQAGADVLRAGGNAVDAAVAACLASWVSEPLLTGPGAGGYMLVAGGGVEPELLDFFVAAPSDGDRAPLLPVLIDFGDAQWEYHVGAATVGVPGNPAGLAMAAARWGTIALGELAAPAAALARAGVAFNGPQAFIANLLKDILRSTPEVAAEFAPGGAVLGEGDVFRSAALARTIERLGEDGAEPFYRGDIAAALAAAVRTRGGTLAEADLAAYEPVLRAPAHVSYRGRTVLTNPPPSAGGILLALAMAKLDVRAGDGPPALTTIVDVMEETQAARDERFDAGLCEPGFLDEFLAARVGSTTHISAVDCAGLACSVTCTNGEGSGVVLADAGIHLNNIMGEEDLSPLGFFSAPAGRRMPSMMAPTIVLRGGGVELVLGSAGSNRIRSAILQTIVGVVDHGLDAAAAVRAPRVHFEQDVVYAEPGSEVEELRAAGREVALFENLNLFFGGVQAVQREPETGRLTGAGDPRRAGAAVQA